MTAPSAAGDSLAQASQLIGLGRLEEARGVLEARMRSGLAEVLAWRLLAQTQQRQGRIAEETETLEAGLRAYPEDVELHAALARARWAGGMGAAFADPFRAAVAAQPQNIALRLKCADMLRQAAMHADAEAMLRDAQKLRPGEIAIQAWLGVVLDEMDKCDEALPMFRQLASAYPREPTLRLNLAHTLLRLGRASEAMPEIGWVRSALPTSQIAIAYEGDALRQLDDPKHRWLSDYDRHIGVYDLAPPSGFSDIAAFNAALGARLRELQKLAAHPLDQTLRGGSQTSQDLLFIDDPLIRQYLAALDAPIRAYTAAMGDDPRHPLDGRKTAAHAISGAWSVLLFANGFHVNHTHEGWISSAYYVSLPEGMSGAGQEGWIRFGEPRWPIPGCKAERMVEPREGRLVLFPSYMWHGTVPFRSGTRLTAPFDVVPVQPGMRS
jgi:tetratricopeptide (TPR) repeat protein